MAALGFAFGVWDNLGPAGRAAAALGIYTDTSASCTADAPGLPDVREAHARPGDPGCGGRPARLPGAGGLVRLPRGRLLQPAVDRGVRIAPVGYVKDSHRDVIAEIANELLRVEGTSIGIAVASPNGDRRLGPRGQRLLGDDPARIVRVINFLLEYAFPGVSGFKHEKRPPHRVEGGACVPHDEAQLRMWSPRGGPSRARRCSSTAVALRPLSWRRSRPEVRAPRGDPGAVLNGVRLARVVRIQVGQGRIGHDQAKRCRTGPLEA